MVETNGERLILNYIRVLQNTRKHKNYYHILGTSGPCFLKYIDLYCILHKYSVMCYFLKIFNLKIKKKTKNPRVFHYLTAHTSSLPRSLMAS